MGEIKSIWKSKTFWVAVIQIIAGILLAVSDQLMAGGALTASGIVAVILRSVTSSGVNWF